MIHEFVNVKKRRRRTMFFLLLLLFYNNENMVPIFSYANWTNIVPFKNRLFTVR